MKKTVLLFTALLLLPLMGFSQFTDVINNSINFEFQTRTCGFTGPSNDGGGPSEPTVTQEIKLIGSPWSPPVCVNWVGTPPTYQSNTNEFLIGGTGGNFDLEYRLYGKMWESDASPHCTYDPTVDDHHWQGFADLRSGGTTERIVFQHDDFRPGQWITQMGNGGANDMYPLANDWYGSIKMCWRYNHGDNFNDPLDFGTLTAGTIVGDINSNRDAPSNTYYPGNLEYTSTDGFSSRDVYYKFTIANNASVTMTTNSTISNFDTHLRLYHTNGDLIALNDDHIGNKAVITEDLCAGTYIVQVEGYLGAQGIFVLGLSLSNLPDLEVTTTATDVSCAGSSDGTLTASGTGGIGTYTYEWFQGFTSLGGGAQLNNVPEGTNYRVEISDDCVQPVSSPNTIIVNGDNTNPVVKCVNGPIQFFLMDGDVETIDVADVDNGSTDNCGIDHMVLSNNQFTIASPPVTTVTMTVFDENQNTGTCQVDVEVINVTSVADHLPLSESVAVYPNPNGGEFTVDVKSDQLDPGTRIIIRDLVGNVVALRQAQPGTQYIRVPNLSAGVYSLTVESDQLLASKRLVIH